MDRARGSSPRRYGVMAAALFLATALPARAVTYYLTVDVPSRLGGNDYTTNGVLRSDNAVYALQEAVPAGVALSSLHRRADTVWLLSLAHPTRLGLSPIYEPRDILSYDGMNFAVYLDGSVIGIPEDVRYDALFQHPSGGVVFSFDVPVKLNGVEYGPSDLVWYSKGFSRYFSAAAAGIPAGTNIVGAALDNTGALVVTFDVPTRILATEFMPGQLVRWDGVAFTSYFVDLSWPASSQLRDFAFVPGAGSVPNGDAAGETPLTITQTPGGDISLAWGRSCLGGDSDYEIYEGMIGSWHSHVPKLCTTSGALTTTITPAAGNRYYLVVPRNMMTEGSYGRTSDGAERQAGAEACLPQMIDTTCHE